ncbi:facilitated trehalose transporter Tret1-like [Aricia agestis]|uniref:facilitated trehalose transporter Tret1-like n=1 Tax=Aricia agestis TaxID=91739 RepID=UPI001C2095C5|nr:facilitated trehalose transporter Tret1-like [Aricia agestis]XP_041985365.1 facilitated trehalose transporter Tret1-like [Aricia agestis]
MKFTVPAQVVRQYVIVLIMNLSIFTTGMNLAWSSPVLVKLRDPDQTPLSRPITEEEGSWLVSIGFLCGLLTNVFGGVLLDSIGRKNCILVSSLPKVFIGFLFIFSTEPWMLIFGRAILMMMEGLVFATVPVYASEIADKEQRGTLGTLFQIFSSLGIVVSLSVGPFVSYIVFNAILTGIIIVASVPLLLLPDSPYYLHSKGRTEEAREVLTLIRTSERQVKEELDGYDKAQEEKLDVSKLTLMRNRTFQKSLVLSLMLGIGGQLIGFNAVSLYLQTILESTKVSVRPEIASVIMGVIQVVASFCATPITSNFRRKTILVWSLMGYFVGMVGLGTFFKITEPEGYIITGFVNYLPIISFILVIYCYSVGIGSLFWLIAAEIFDGVSRAFGFSISLTTVTFFIFLTTKYFVVISNFFGPAITYWIFSGITILLTILIAVFLPETKGKSFNEIQKSLQNNSDDVKKCPDSVL